MRINVLIIGGGVSGASIAYHLAKKGIKDIVVVDKSYFTAGATGRCGAGVRQQWATKTNCILAKRSIEFFEKAKEILEYDKDLEFKQEGYLILATTPEEQVQFQKNVQLQNECGIPSRYITKEEALAIVPHLNPDAFLSATFCPTDGHLNPFKMTEAYILAAKKLGVEFRFFEEVKAIITENHQVTQVITTKATYEVNQVVNAAGGYSREIGLMAHVDIPVYSENHEILATEPTEKMQGPMVMSFSKNIYCQQVPHGSFLMGRSDPDVEKNHNTESTWKFLDEMAKTATYILPALGKLRVVRQWGGLYNMSPDRQPILGAVEEMSNFFIACGFSGHGFMFAPITGEVVSDIMCNHPTSIDISELSIQRFKYQTDFHVEKSVV
ncbi:MAG TPA: FAD-dependent oxidoreductase [Erysipelotrichaceae bacterium]|nr:FAD-dependent oxidoreductase [Erysipelotrichaceae bacterium]